MSQVDPSRQATLELFTRASGQGLLQLLLDGLDLLSAGPAPDNVSGRSYAVYLEGVETIAHVLQEVQDEDQLGYAIDPGRHVHFFAGGQHCPAPPRPVQELSLYWAVGWGEMARKRHSPERVIN